MQEMDKHFTLVPWKAAESTKPLIKEMDKILSIMSKFRVYFCQAQTKFARGTVYADTYVQHLIPILDLKGGAEWIMKENKMGIVNKTLQVESTSQMG